MVSITKSSVAIALVATLLSSTAAFSPHPISRNVLNKATKTRNQNDNPNDDSPPLFIQTTRSTFLSTAITSSLLGLLIPPSSANARGRATLEQSYDRYSPRILAGGQYYASDLKKIIGSNDWKALKAATSDPPKKTKEDRTKVDGGISERAAQAGGFSDARVLVAMDLYAAAFSDNSVSGKTKAMQGKVEALRNVVKGMNAAAKQALGEEDGGGGFLGMGKKKVSEKELAVTVRQLYVEGGNKWNEYVYEANEGLAVQFKKLPYL